MEIILFDNYDSFTYNLLHQLQMVRPAYRFSVIRNSDKTILAQKPDALVVGPGPMTPAETGYLRTYFEHTIIPHRIPVLGVCLGMQFITWYCNIPVVRSTRPAHGAAVKIEHTATDIFEQITKNFYGARYNSLEVRMEDISDKDEFLLLASAQQNNAVMAVRHRQLPWTGVQFHPESFLTTYGNIIIDNFFKKYVENKG